MVGGHATVGRLSNNVFWTLQAIRKFFEKVTERSRDSGRRSRDRWLTVKQRFFDVSSNYEKFWKKSLNGHATVVGGHATVGRLSNNVFRRVKQLWKFLKKSHWTVTRQWSKVTRPSADCQTTFFGCFMQLGKIFKKSLNGHATVVGGHATVGRLSNNVFWTFQAIRKIFEKSHWTVTRQWSEVPRPLADCQTTFFGRFKQFGKFLKKVTQRSRDNGRRSRDRWPRAYASAVFRQLGNNNIYGAWQSGAWLSKNVYRRFKQFGKILKKVTERSRDSGRRSGDRRPTVKQRFFDVSSNSEKFWKKSLNGHPTVVGGHATVGRLSTNVFSTFQAIRENFEKSRWTVMRQWLEVTRPSTDCHAP